MLTQAPRGTHDMLPDQAHAWHHLERTMREICALGGYREVRTPMFEHTELFLRSIGDTTDVVQKEMYTFEDKGGRSITLRPEGTAGVVRAFIEHGLFNQPLPARMYYLASPVFRYEAPQSGRLRQHHQFGIEVFGAAQPGCDAEVIMLARDLVASLGIEGTTLHLNSIGCADCRRRYNEALLAFLNERRAQLCQTCGARIERNPLRVLDCKEEKCQAALAGVPQTLDWLCEACADHFNRLCALMKDIGVPYIIDPFLVRGLDYYTRTVFEIKFKTPQGELTLCGGGRYDRLIEQIGGPSIAAVGFGMGMERLLMVLEQSGTVIPAPQQCAVYFASIGQAAADRAFSLARGLRAAGIQAASDIAGRSLKAQFKYADKLKCRFVAVLGDQEMERGVVRLRDMAQSQEAEVEIGRLIETVRAAMDQPL